MGINNMTLVKIAAFGGIATCTMGMAWRFKVNDNISQTEYYKEAFKTLRSNKGAVHLLGEPIKDNLLDLGDVEKNYTKELSAHYEVPIKGPKQRGTLHFWASRKNTEDSWKVDRIELGLKNDPSKRLLVKGEKYDT